MTYLPLAILLAVGLCTLSFFGDRLRGHEKIFAAVNGVLAGVGAAIVIVTTLIAQSRIHSGSLDETYVSWASDMFGIYFQISLPVLAVLFAVTAISSVLALFDEKQHSGIAPKIRSMTICASSILLLILAPFYGFMTENETLPLYTYICWCGAGQALFMRSVCVSELFGRLRHSVKKM